MFARLIHVLIASVVVLLPGTASAQAYPTKPIRLIVPFSPGGTNDILGRMVATHLTEKPGQTMIVDMGAEIDIKTPDEMRKVIPVEIAEWTQVAIEAGMPRAVK